MVINLISKYLVMKSKIFFNYVKKIINKIGISIYETKELDLIWNILKPDLVQVPINIIDHRFIQYKWPLKLKKKKLFRIKKFENLFVHNFDVLGQQELKIMKSFLLILKK